MGQSDKTGQQIGAMIEARQGEVTHCRCGLQGQGRLDEAVAGDANQPVPAAKDHIAAQRDPAVPSRRGRQPIDQRAGRAVETERNCAVPHRLRVGRNDQNGSARLPPEEVIAKIRPPGPMRPWLTTSWVQ